LISKRGVVAPANHVLKLAITRHKARLSAELTKARIKGGYATLEAFKDALVSEQADGPPGSPRPLQHPRWVRINTLKTTLEEQLSSTFASYEKADSLGQILSAASISKMYFLDPHIPNLLALPSKVDLSKTKAYMTGCIIFQDKASCFPAYLLDPRIEDGDLIDGCAAPGNKTTHLAAILTKQTGQSQERDMQQKVIAFERDKLRTKTLEKMVKLASADQVVTIKGGHDFLEAKPDSQEFANVGAILLDPSCSGTGIVGRDDSITIHLPDPQSAAHLTAKAGKGKKRKRDEKPSTQPSAALQLDVDDSVPEETPIEDKLSERLNSLAGFQLKILTHAMRFPKARKITYSTCSIHFEENEGVVFRALASSEAVKYGWTILKRKDQVSGMKEWPKRGIWEDGKLDNKPNVVLQEKPEVLEACIRCDKATEDGTMGFFVAAFVRYDSKITDSFDSSHNANVEDGLEEGDEWAGFSDEETALPQTGEQHEISEPKESKPKKKKRKNK
jgi:putative methyltransferase